MAERFEPFAFPSLHPYNQGLLRPHPKPTREPWARSLARGRWGVGGRGAFAMNPRPGDACSPHRAGSSRGRFESSKRVELGWFPAAGVHPSSLQGCGGVGRSLFRNLWFRLAQTMQQGRRLWVSVETTVQQRPSIWRLRQVSGGVLWRPWCFFRANDCGQGPLSHFYNGR